MDELHKRFWDTFEQMQEDVDRFFDHFARAKRPSMVMYRTRWSPPCNVYDAADHLRVLIEIAGVQREALDLRIEEDRLVLCGIRPEPELPEKVNYIQIELDFGEFELEIALAVPVDAEAAQAWYHDGFLSVVLPKIPEPKPLRVKLSIPEKS